MLTGASVSSCHAESINETLAKVFIVYRSLLHGLSFDKNDIGLNDDAQTMGEQFRRDCEHVEKNKKGTCMHLSHYLISKLYELGIKAEPLYILGNNNGYRHIAVLYDVCGEKFVADITADVVAIAAGDLERINAPWFSMDDLQAFIEYQKEENNVRRIFSYTKKLVDDDTDMHDVAPYLRIIYNVTANS